MSLDHLADLGVIFGVPIEKLTNRNEHEAELLCNQLGLSIFTGARRTNHDNSRAASRRLLVEKDADHTAHVRLNLCLAPFVRGHRENIVLEMAFNIVPVEVVLLQAVVDNVIETLRFTLQLRVVGKDLLLNSLTSLALRRFEVNDLVRNDSNLFKG